MLLVKHSVILALTYYTKLKESSLSTTLVIVIYGREIVLQVVHNRGHDFQKDLPCRGAQQDLAACIPQRSKCKRTKEAYNENHNMIIKDVGSPPTKLPAFA